MFLEFHELETKYLVGYLKNADTDTRTRTRGHGKRGHGKRGHGKRGHGKRGQAYKNSCMVDGLPCNRFGLPEKFHVSFKY